MVPAMDQVLVERRDRVVLPTLNRPDRLNAISGSKPGALSVALPVDADPEVRCMVLTGGGRGFCGGLDLVGMPSGDGIEMGVRAGTGR